MKNKRTTKINKANIKPKNKALRKSYIKDDNPKLGHNNKTDIKNFTGIISGQNHLAHNENKMDKSVNPYCKHCPGTRETTEHFVAECPIYSSHRMQVFQHPTINFKLIFAKYSPHVICKFINLTGRMNEENDHRLE
jgi:hypothetical protein